MKKPQQKEAPKPVSTRTEPCGCIVTKMSDGTEQVQPCVFHGLIRAGQLLADAGQALGIVANRIMYDQEKARQPKIVTADEVELDRIAKDVAAGKGRNGD